MENFTDIKIYCSAPTSRLEYVTRFLSDSMGIPFRLTTDTIVSGCFIHYGLTPDSRAFNIPESGFLNKKGIEPFFPETMKDGVVCLFPVRGAFDLAFDLFAAMFYLLSRYEEYLPYQPDAHGRFEVTQSFAFRNDFHMEPVIDQWLLLFRKALIQKYPGLTIKERKYHFISTIDIDSPWAVINRQTGRNLAGITKNILTGRFQSAWDRLQVLAGRKDDPFDIYSFVRETEKENNFKSLFFFLLSNNGKNDINYSLERNEFRALIEDLSEDHEIGIHPSYISNIDKGKFKNEIELYRSFTGRMPDKSRQHFLLLKFPETYRRLIDHGIKEDYSMGFASLGAFRAGTTLPFRFYDLEEEKTTGLIIHPITIMDVTLKQYMKLDPERACQEITHLIEGTKKVNGTFCSLWHNESLSDSGVWKGWKNVFIHMVKTATTIS